MNSEDPLSRFASCTGRALGLLYQDGLHGQMLVVLYSAIDTLGLLDAPPDHEYATPSTFQNWVGTYMAPDSRFEATPLDLWAARCSVLHTFTSTSKLSQNGSAKELQYYGGQKDSAEARHFIAYTSKIHGGMHIPVHLGDLCEVFIAGFGKFAPAFRSKCDVNPKYRERLRNVLQVHPLQPVA